jgi:histone acetyltransferase HTATIP/histone acetyltransferase MYST1
MASKGKGKGKQSKCEMELQKKTTIIHEGAMDNSYFINGQMKNGEWFKARVVDCRLSKDYDPREEKGEFSYEYYIHYENINRRNDEWVSRERI